MIAKAAACYADLAFLDLDAATTRLFEVTLDRARRCGPLGDDDGGREVVR